MVLCNPIGVRQLNIMPKYSMTGLIINFTRGFFQRVKNDIFIITGYHSFRQNNPVFILRIQFFSIIIFEIDYIL